MELIEGIAIFVGIVLLGLHLTLHKYKKTRMLICIGVAIGLSLTKTMHGIMFAILLISCELIINKLTDWYLNQK